MNETTNALMPNRTYKSRIFEMIFSNKKELLRLYNGTAWQPDKMELRLSDAFLIPEDDPHLELKATMLNINKGHNQQLMNACKTLKDYAEFTSLVRELAQAIPLEKAVEQAVNHCISHGLLEEFLKKNKAEAIKMSIYEYDEERHMRQTREEGWEDGWEGGWGAAIQKCIKVFRKANHSEEQILAELMEEFELTREDAMAFLSSNEE